VRRFLWIQIRTIVLIPLIFLFLFCPIHLGYGSAPKAEKDSSEGRFLAKINKEPLTQKRFHDYLKDHRILSSNDLKEDQKKKENALHDLIRDILIDQKAFALDMSSDSGFVEEKKKHMNDFLLEHLHNNEVVAKTQITDQEIKDYYEQHKDQFYAIPEKREIRQLLIRIDVDPTQRNYKRNLRKADKEAKKKIEALYQRAKAGDDFSELARQYSEDTGRLDVSGNLGYVEKGNLSPPLDSVAFSLKVGEISAPVKDETGYYLISVLDVKPKEYREFDEKVIRGIRGLLEQGRIQEKTQEYVTQVMERTKFVYHDQILNQPDSLIKADDWALIINDQDTITSGYYASKISWYKGNVGKDSLTLEDKKDLLRNFLAMPITLVREAEKLGYRDSMDYRVEERAFTLDEAKKKLQQDKLKKDFPPPTREEAKAYYQAHKIDYPSLGVPIHVYHILFQDSLKAVEVLNQIRNGADFVELAKQYYPGEPEIKDVAYDLGFITQDEMPPSFYQKALSLDTGEVSEPVRTQWGFHLIKVVEKEKEGKTFEDILPKIEEDMKWKKIDEYQKEWEESLFDEAQIWLDKKLLKEFKLDKPQG
jgi:foldase protein PrsA